MRTFNDMKAELADRLRTYKINRPSPGRTSLYALRDEGRLDEVADVVLSGVIGSLIDNRILSNTCKGIGTQLFNLTHADVEMTNSKRIRYGTHMINACAEIGLIDIEKIRTRDFEAHEAWYIIIKDKGLKEVIDSHHFPELRLDNGETPWTGSHMWINDRRLDIVKGMRTYKMSHNYTVAKMPAVYECLNKLNRTPWAINEDVLKVMQEGIKRGEAVFMDREVTDREKSLALKAIGKAQMTALWLEEIHFKRLVQTGYDEETAQRYSRSNAEEYCKTKQFDHLETVSMWSKNQAMMRSIKIAKQYAGSQLNFIHDLDSRGRVYVKQQHLTPQASDYSKALLMFHNPKPISTYDFTIHLANCAGQDKKSFAERVEWVQAHADNLYSVGASVWSSESQQWLLNEGIEREGKTRWQFIAACIEFKRMMDWQEEHGNVDEFLCRISIGYDGSCSGLQVLSILGRDEAVAPYVNITETDKPGDVYALIGLQVFDYLEANYDDLSDGLKRLVDEFPRGHKMWRKICKRNVMTKSYSATRIGMGDQQWEDRKTYGHKLCDELTIKECRQLGAIVYDVCSTGLPKATQLMETFKAAVRKTDKVTVTWTMPSGFTAFQHKEVMKTAKCPGTIGGHKVTLIAKEGTGKPAKLKHQNAVAPDAVHSYDAWLLLELVNSMPETANLHVIHDQFNSDSCHGGDIQDCARLAYEAIGSRTVLEEVLYQIAGEAVDLPEAGTFRLEEIRKAEYIVS